MISIAVFFQSFESNHGVFTKPLYCVTKIVGQLKDKNGQYYSIKWLKYGFSLNGHNKIFFVDWFHIL